MEDEQQKDQESQTQEGVAEQANNAANAENEGAQIGAEVDLITVDDTHDITTVFADPYKTKGVAHSNYVITSKSGNVLARINFQDGLVSEVGSNGVMAEDLLAIVIDRLIGFQSGPYACNENATALSKVNSALIMLKQRTQDRKNRGVQSTYAK